MIPQGVRVYFAVAPTDVRRSFDGLATTAQSVLGKDPAKGGLFVFINKRGDQVRVLFRDRNSWCVLAKRLDGGRFDRRFLGDGVCREADAAKLMRFLEEIVPSRAEARSAAVAIRPQLSLLPSSPNQ